MTKYERDRVRIWIVGVKGENSSSWQPTGLQWFRTRAECKEHIDNFRRGREDFYSGMKHKPMVYMPENK